MGIKDNFSQAVKELWKKDGQEQGPAQPSGQPTELDSYLRRQSSEEQNAAPEQTFQDGGTDNVPLETPYYRTAPQNNGENAAPQSTQNSPLKSIIPDQGGQSGFDGEPGINMNVQNIRQNFGQNSQNVQAPQADPNVQPMQEGPQNVQSAQAAQNNYNQNAYPNQGGYNPNVSGGYNQGGGYGGGGYVPPAAGGGTPMQAANETDETTIISKNTVIDGNIRSLANMQIDGNIKGNVETTRNVDMSGKIVGDITCNNAGMNSAAMQGNVSLKGRMKMDRDTILIGDLSSQYADINGRIRGKLDIVGKAELKRDAIVFGDINASTIAVTDGAIIQGYVNTTFLSKEDSRNVFPEAISFDNKEGQTNPKAN